MPFFLLVPILLMMAVVCVAAALLAIALLAVTAVTGLSIVFVLHKYGYDQRLLAFLVDRDGAPPPGKTRLDDLDLPVSSSWAFGDSRSYRPE